MCCNYCMIKNKHGKLTYESLFKQYMSGELKLEKYQKIGVLLLVIVLSGIFGWVYEFIIYYFDGGTGEFYMQGGNFLPWINIYAIGAVLIIIATQRIKRRPWAVFLVAMVVSGIVELIGGWLVYTMFDGARYWDYNTEILNFGNIGGFVCLRSVLFFGVSALFLTYVMVPFCIFLSKRMSKRAFLILSIALFTIFMVDEIYNLLASKVFGWQGAMDFYRSIGWKYLT